MTAVAQRRVAGATALMIMFYLLQMVILAPPTQASHHTVIDPAYWDAQYPNSVGCHNPYDGHGSIHEDDEGNQYVMLETFQLAWNAGDHWEVLIVFGEGNNHDHAVYEHPDAGVAYYPPLEGQSEVGRWIVCKGEDPDEVTTTTTTEATTTTTTTQATTTTTVPQVTTTVPEVTTTIPFDDLPEPESEVVEVLGETVVAEVVAETLPFTGFETGDVLRLGLLALVSGGLMLFAVPGRRDETSSMGGWTNV